MEVFDNFLAQGSWKSSFFQQFLLISIFYTGGKLKKPLICPLTAKKHEVLI